MNISLGSIHGFPNPDAYQRPVKPKHHRVPFAAVRYQVFPQRIVVKGSRQDIGGMAAVMQIEHPKAVLACSYHGIIAATG
jgi:hypothetical protein